MEAHTPEVEIGRLVIAGLDRTELDIPEVTRDDLKRLLRPLLKLSGVRSYTAFASGTISIGIDRDVAGALTITPTENRGQRGGFAYLPHDAVALPSGTGETEVGQAVRKALALSRSSVVPRKPRQPGSPCPARLPS